MTTPPEARRNKSAGTLRAALMPWLMPCPVCGWRRRHLTFCRVAKR